MFQVSCVDSEMILKKSFALLSLIYFLVEKPEIHLANFCFSEIAQNNPTKGVVE
jgi:hypothetical protein